MARVQLQVDDAAHRLTLRTLLQAEGHIIAADEGDVLLTDSVEAARERAGDLPTLCLVPVSEVPKAIESMKAGAYGYILLPLQRGEAELMVQRAAAQRAGRPEASRTRMIPLEEVEDEHIRNVLRACKHNRAEAARILKIGRNTLWRKLKKLGEGG